MTETMEKLYELVERSASIEGEQMEKFKAFAKAKLAVLEEIETAEGKEKIELLDVLSSLDGQTEELRKKALFQETLLLGIELGRLRPRDID